MKSFYDPKHALVDSDGKYLYNTFDDIDRAIATFSGSAAERLGYKLVEVGYTEVPMEEKNEAV